MDLYEAWNRQLPEDHTEDPSYLPRNPPGPSILMMIWLIWLTMRKRTRTMKITVIKSGNGKRPKGFPQKNPNGSENERYLRHLGINYPLR
jgi:hypothetical protein